jgi:hypothetical protein
MIEESNPKLVMLRFRTYNPNAIPRIIRERPEYMPKVGPDQKIPGVDIIPSTQECDVIALMDDMGTRGYQLVETQWRQVSKAERNKKALYTWALIYVRGDAVAKEGDEKYPGYLEFLKTREEVDRQVREQLKGKAGAVMGTMNCHFENGVKSETENALVLSCAALKPGTPKMAMRMGENLIVAPEAVA